MTTKRRSKRTPVLLTGLAVAAALTACGSDGASDAPAGEEEQVRSVYHRIAEAFQAGDAKSVCSSLTPRARETTANTPLNKGGTCEAWVRLVLKEGRNQATPKVVKVEVTGDRASVTARANGQSFDVPFVKTGAGWKTDQPLVQ